MEGAQQRHTDRADQESPLSLVEALAIVRMLRLSAIARCAELHRLIIELQSEFEEFSQFRNLV